LRAQICFPIIYDNNAYEKIQITQINNLEISIAQRLTAKFKSFPVNNNDMEAKIDKRGRIYLPKPVRKKLGESVYLTEFKDGILIIPKPKDPVRQLEELGKLITAKTITEIKKDIEDEAMKETK